MDVSGPSAGCEMRSGRPGSFREKGNITLGFHTAAGSEKNIWKAVIIIIIMHFIFIALFLQRISECHTYSENK